jgi:REP element-mobilizing transposase RayT
MALEPIYTTDNCNPAYQLNWAVSLFANQSFPEATTWVESVRSKLENDGVRILEFRPLSEKVLALLLSTKPTVDPAKLLQVSKGRLQYAIRETHPRVFRRNYRLESVGSAKGTVIERYIGRQSQRHPMADSRIQQRLEALQVVESDIDLSRVGDLSAPHVEHDSRSGHKKRTASKGRRHRS